MHVCCTGASIWQIVFEGCVHRFIPGHEDFFDNL